MYISVCLRGDPSFHMITQKAGWPSQTMARIIYWTVFIYNALLWKPPLHFTPLMSFKPSNYGSRLKGLLFKTGLCINCDLGEAGLW